jgi:uncharacterized membrane protein
MKAIATFIRTTLAGGVIFLLPIIVLVMLLGKAAQIAHKIVAPLAAHIPFESFIGLEAPRFLAILLLVIFCFLAGILAQSAAARKATDKVESALLSNLPGYEFLKSLSVKLLAPESAPVRPVVLARIEDSWQIGLLVERMEAGHVAVYVPGTPEVKSGAVYLMGEDRIRMTDVPAEAAVKCVKRYGVGAKELFGSRLDFPVTDTSSNVSGSARDSAKG